MKNRIKWFIWACALLPALVGLWLFVGVLFVAVPFVALINPSLFEKEVK